LAAVAQELKRTPLFAAHRRAGAKMVEFAGWEMPVQYRGLIEEHRSVRSRAGLFDVSHMGEIEVRGEGAAAFCQRLTANDVSRMAVFPLAIGCLFYLRQCFEQRQGFFLDRRACRGPG
jgi:glycine cleavage system aminomethyltransferase T